jgi:hypothetical protein
MQLGELGTNGGRKFNGVKMGLVLVVDDEIYSPRRNLKNCV